MSDKSADPIEQMWEHLDDLQQMADSIRKSQGDSAAQPLIALAIRMGDTLSDIQQRPDEDTS